MNTYRAGIDIGSTTVKLVLLDEEGKLLFGEYRRHCAHTQEALSALLREARERVGDCALRAKITGSGAINLAKALGIPFVQEVVAVAERAAARGSADRRGHRARRRGREDHLLRYDA